MGAVSSICSHNDLLSAALIPKIGKMLKEHPVSNVHMRCFFVIQNVLMSRG